jgi:superfamily II DNA or RNA helicase
LSGGAPRRPIEETVDLLGDRLLSDDTVGSWLRVKLLEGLSPSRWRRMADLYRGVAGMGQYWHRGSRWATEFCRIGGLPETLARRRDGTLVDDEEVVPAEPLPPLHDFQVEVYRSLRRLFRDGRGKAAMLSLPTGAGKTRVAVEALCDHFAEETEEHRRRNLALWIAQSQELQQQAWECLRQVWQVPPQRSGGSIRRTLPLRIVRAWGGRDPDTIDYGDEPTVIVASVDQLASWARRRPEFFECFPRNRLAAVILDEAHAVITREYRYVLMALGLRQKHRWESFQDAPPVVGLSATPWRSDDEGSRMLRSYFQQRLLRPGALGRRPVAELRRRGILSRVDAQRLVIRDAPEMSRSQKARFEQFNEVPTDYLEALGLEGRRNGTILRRLERLRRRQRTLVFACSVSHAEVLAMALDGYYNEDCAAVVTAQTPRSERADVIERFRSGDLRFLCNVGVLATGFDAPTANAVCMTRPTTSALKYEQMVGRGLRGPRNGGTAMCTVLDVQDLGLPDGIQSYARVLHLWDRH